MFSVTSSRQLGWGVGRPTISLSEVQRCPDPKQKTGTTSRASIFSRLSAPNFLPHKTGKYWADLEYHLLTQDVSMKGWTFYTKPPWDPLADSFPKHPKMEVLFRTQKISSPQKMERIRIRRKTTVKLLLLPFFGQKHHVPTLMTSERSKVESLCNSRWNGFKSHLGYPLIYQLGWLLGICEGFFPNGRWELYMLNKTDQEMPQNSPPVQQKIEGTSSVEKQHSFPICSSRVPWFSWRISRLVPNFSWELARF